MSMVEQVRAALESYRLDSVSADEARVAIEAMREPPAEILVALGHHANRFQENWQAAIDAALGKEE